MNLEKGLVDKRIPKNRFLISMPEVEAIIWRYKIARSTTGIGDSDEYRELQIFNVRFRGAPTTKYFVKIQAAIPYKILFSFQDGDVQRYSLVVGNRVMTTDERLMENDELAVSALTIKTLYERLVERISGGRRREDENIDEFVSRRTMIDRLKYDIEKMQHLVDTEKQPRKRFEYNDKLKELKRKLDTLQ